MLRESRDSSNSIDTTTMSIAPFRLKQYGISEKFRQNLR